MGYARSLVEALEVQVNVCRRVQAPQLDLDSACPGWSIREVMDHTLGVTLKFADFASGVTDRPHAPRGDLVGADHRATVRHVVDTARQAWGSAEMRRTCDLGFGTFPAELAAGINLFDVLAHTWDIAAPLSIAVEAADELWGSGLEAARAVIGTTRDPVHYAPELLSTATDQPYVRFLRYLGREGC